MQIDIISDVLTSGGAQKVAGHLASGLNVQGHSVSFFTEYDGKPQLGKNGIHYQWIPYTRLWHSLRFGPSRKLRYLFAPITGFSWDYPLAERTMRRMKTDIYSIHNIHGRRIPLTLPFRLSADTPVIWTFHDMWPVTGGCLFAMDSDGFTKDCCDCPCQIPAAPHRHDNDDGWNTRKSLWRSNHNITIVTPSHWLRREIKRSALARHVAVEVIPNGIDTEVFCPGNQKRVREKLKIDPQAKVILILASHLNDKRKGPDDAEKIIFELLRSDHRVRILFVGRKSDEFASKWKGRAMAFPFSSDPAMIAQYYIASDVFLFTSKAENLPLTILEAMACGIPVAAFDCGGISEEIDAGKCGFLVNVGDIQGCIEAIITILKDTILARKVGVESRQRITKEFTIDKMVQGYEQLMQRLTESDQPNTPTRS